MAGPMFSRRRRAAATIQTAVQRHIARGAAAMEQRRRDALAAVRHAASTGDRSLLLSAISTAGTACGVCAHHDVEVYQVLRAPTASTYMPRYLRETSKTLDTSKVPTRLWAVTLCALPYIN